MIMSTPWLTPIVADSDHAEANAVSYEALDLPLYFQTSVIT